MNKQKNNATCSICGKAYYMCNSCKDMKNLQPYKLHTDTVEHFKVYQIIHGYSTGVYDIAETKAKLQTVDLSDMKDYKDNINKIIKTILAYDDNKNTKTNETKTVSKRVRNKSNKTVETDNKNAD